MKISILNLLFTGFFVLSALAFADTAPPADTDSSISESLSESVAAAAGRKAADDVKKVTPGYDDEEPDCE